MSFNSIKEIESIGTDGNKPMHFQMKVTEGKSYTVGKDMK